MTRPRAWERMPEETTRAYAAFEAYLCLGPQRSLRKVSQEIGKSAAFLSRWSSRYSWVERAGCYDSEAVERQRRLTLAAEAAEARRWAARMKDLREEEYQLGVKLLEKAKSMLAVPHFSVTVEQGVEALPDGKTLVRKVTIIKPARWRLADAARLIELASKLMRLSLGMQTAAREVVPSGDAGQDDSDGLAAGMSDDELAAVIRGADAPRIVPPDCQTLRG